MTSSANWAVMFALYSCFFCINFSVWLIGFTGERGVADNVITNAWVSFIELFCPLIDLLFVSLPVSVVNISVTVPPLEAIFNRRTCRFTHPR